MQVATVRSIAMFAVSGAVLAAVASLTGQAPPRAPAAPPAPFRMHLVAAGLRGGAQVVATDMNHDGKVDLIGLGSAMGELRWYENPDWTPHVIVRDIPRMINLAAADTDRDGIPELALAYGFANAAAQSTGTLAILKAKGDPRGLWTLTEIDAVPTSHRVRFARIGTQAVLVNTPILGAEARQGFADPGHTPTPLMAYRAPGWKRETVTNANLGVVHGLFAGDWNGDGRDDVLTAGYVGVHAHTLARTGAWTRREIVKGNPLEWPLSGAGDVAVGTMNKKKFFVTIEPFHGNQVVVYLDAADGRWSRNVIETALSNADSLLLLDSDGDGNHEIVSGGTRRVVGAPGGTKPGVFFYKATDPSGLTWNRMLLDGGIAASSCAAADINGDRKMDIACIDNTDPWTLRWYENDQG